MARRPRPAGRLVSVDDLWYLRDKDPATGQRRPSKRYGRGKRWRVRWVAPQTGEPRTELFERKADADRHDVNMHADISRGQYIDPRAGRVTVAEYAETWRTTQLHRDSTADLVERALRLHIVPLLGHYAMAEVRPSHLRSWVAPDGRAAGDRRGSAAGPHQHLPAGRRRDRGPDRPRNVVVRSARLLFVTGNGLPLHRSNWSTVWRSAVRRARLPQGFGLHGLRHYFAGQRSESR